MEHPHSKWFHLESRKKKLAAHGSIELLVWQYRITRITKVFSAQERKNLPDSTSSIGSMNAT
jgi:hypothetical protein